MKKLAKNKEKTEKLYAFYGYDSLHGFKLKIWDNQQNIGLSRDIIKKEIKIAKQPTCLHNLLVNNWLIIV